MSPRSKEFMDEARECLAAARDLLATKHPGRAASDAYYAMLYAARAALSEESKNAKTHKGAWGLFSDLFVRTGRIDEELFDATKEAQRYREAADYDAAMVDAEVAQGVVHSAERFVTAVEDILGEPK